MTTGSSPLNDSTDADAAGTSITPEEIPTDRRAADQTVARDDGGTPGRQGGPGSGRGWGGDEVVRDQGGSEEASPQGWSGGQIDKDHVEEPVVEGAGGWTGEEVVRDHSTVESSELGGWSADEVVKDHGEP